MTRKTLAELVQDEIGRQERTKIKTAYDRLQETKENLTWQCPHCNVTHKPEIVIANGQTDLNWDEIVYPGRCTCALAVQEQKTLLMAKQQQDKLAHKLALENNAKWRKFNPTWYQSSDINKTKAVHKIFQTVQAQVMASHLNQLEGTGLVISGRVGCGKTLLLKAVTEASEGLVLSENDLKMALVANDAARLMKSCISKKVLLIDDIGGEELDSEKALWLKGLLGNFYRQMLGEREDDPSKKTYFTTNCPYADNPLSPYPRLVEKIGERAFSRIENIFESPDNWISLWDVPSYRSRKLVAN